MNQSHVCQTCLVVLGDTDSIRILRSALRPAPRAQLSFLMQCLQTERTLGRDCKCHQCRRCAGLAIVSREGSGDLLSPKKISCFSGEQRDILPL